MVKVLFVCLGNICRSPTAEGVFTQLVKQEKLSAEIKVDSAGTIAYHAGSPPDRRAQEAALKRAIDISHLRGRLVKREDFYEFDYILAMDTDNYETLHALCPADQKHKIRLFLDFAPQTNRHEVPDPYSGGAQGFELVLDLVEAASVGLLADICHQYALKH